MRRVTRIGFGIVLWCAAFASTSAADTYPSKPIVILSWSAAGSPVDVMARQIAAIAPKYLGQPMVAEDKTGASGGNALDFLVSQPADGYTLLAVTDTITVSLNTVLKDKFKPDQFVFLGALVSDPYIIGVRTESPLKTWADLVKATKAQSFSIGGPFAQSAESFFAREMGQTVGIKFQWVPYNGGSPSVAAALGGHVDAVCTNVSAVAAFVKAGQMRVLAVSTPQSIESLPGTPTFASLGFKSLTSAHWRGVVAKAGIPADVKTKLVNFVKQVSDDGDFKSYVVKSSLFPRYADPATVDKMVADQMAAISKDIAAGIGAK